MKIKKYVNLEELRKFGYRYEENLIYPTYRKVLKQGKGEVIIEILVLNREIFINKNSKIKKEQYRYINDLKRFDLLE